jgi:hypothetical protein
MANAWDVISSELPKFLREMSPRKVITEERGVMTPLARRGTERVIDNPDITPADVMESAADVLLPLAFYSGDVEAATGAKALKGKGAIGKTVKALRKPKSEGFALTPESLPILESVTKPELRAVLPKGEEDIARSFGADPRLKGGGTIPASEVSTALRNRERYRAEPRTLPKRPEEMSPQEWEAYGAQYGADFRQNPMQSLGVSDIATKREIMVPGGLEGKFTIPDLFAIKANNFDPTVIGQEKHNELMGKFLRTYQREGPHDPVDTFNDLNFALLSPNAPLTQNEFLAQRLRARTPEDLEALAAREGTPDLGAAIDAESGVGAASRGGMGVKGTAELENQATLARLLREKPEMFQPGEGETLRDVGFRTMNQVPGLSVKTASLGVPWTDLSKANTSAVDLWMIRKNYPRLLEENPRFAQRMADLRATNPGLSEEEAAIKIIGSGHPQAVYRTKSGELHPDLPDYLQPEKLAFEPGKFTRPNEFYQDIMRYVDESRQGAPHELFPEQWRLWDTYRGRVEPHEMAHPDWRKLPKQSFSELQDALTEHKRMGYMSAPEAELQPTKMQGDWRKLYYGKADPRLLLGAATAGGGAAGALKAKSYIEQLRAQRDAQLQAADQQGEQ